MQTAALPLFSQSALAPTGRNKKFTINNLDTQIIYKAVLLVFKMNFLLIFKLTNQEGSDKQHQTMSITPYANTLDMTQEGEL